MCKNKSYICEVIMLFFFCLGTLPAKTAEIPLPPIVSEQYDPAWQAAFAAELANSLDASFLQPRSLELLAQLLDQEDFPADPVLAAAEYFQTASDLDSRLKRGVPMPRIKATIKISWQEKKEATAKQGNALNKTIKQDKQLKNKSKAKINNKVKEKKEKIKQGKEEKEKKEKEKDEKEKN